jgi:hypothetical protein
LFLFFEGEYILDYVPTAVFVDDVDELFESSKIVSQSAYGKPLRSPLSDKSPHIGH